jgi:hypothetical protein
VQLAVARHDNGALTGLAIQAGVDLGTCHANVTTLKGSLAHQNAAVAAQKVQADRTAAALDQAAAAARNARAVAVSRAETIAAIKPTADACSQAEAVLRGN